MIRTGYLAVDLVMVGVIIFQGWNFASNPNFINAANSIALLGIAAIGAWQATKAAARDKIIVSIKKQLKLLTFYQIAQWESS